MLVSDLIVRGSMWLALSCFVAGHVGFRRARPSRAARWAVSTYWLGLALAMAHAAAAFHWHHDWSHARAVAATAAETARTFGLDWGGGVWVNYGFLATWLADATWRTARRTPGPSGSAAAAWPIRGFYLIVIASGAVVFVAWPMTLLGVALVAVLLWSWRP